jgi:hypothetical protein
MLDFFVNAFDSDLPFFEKIKSSIENHLDFIAENPGLPFFILREIVQNEERRQMIHERFAPMAFDTVKRFSVLMQDEIAKGSIRPIHPQDLLLNIISLNVFSFIALNVFFGMQSDAQPEILQQFLAERKKNNVETIINSIKL